MLLFSTATFQLSLVNYSSACQAMDPNKMLTYRQDLPPPGGYRPFDWTKIPPRPRWKHYSYYALFAGMTAFGYVGFFTTEKIRNILRLEDQDHKLATEPFLVAERDRMIIRQVRLNRAEEERIMKDVPGWQVGKYFDEPLFFTTPPDTWFEPDTRSLWVHAPYNRFYRHYYSSFYT